MYRDNRKSSKISGHKEGNQHGAGGRGRGQNQETPEARVIVGRNCFIL